MPTLLFSMPGGAEWIVLLFSILPLVVLYLVVKYTVKTSIKEAIKELKKEGVI